MDTSRSLWGVGHYVSSNAIVNSLKFRSLVNSENAFLQKLGRNIIGLHYALAVDGQAKY